MRDLHLLVESQSYCSPVTVVKCVLKCSLFSYRRDSLASQQALAQTTGCVPQRASESGGGHMPMLSEALQEFL